MNFHLLMFTLIVCCFTTQSIAGNCPQSNEWVTTEKNEKKIDDSWQNFFELPIDEFSLAADKSIHLSIMWPKHKKELIKQYIRDKKENDIKNELKNAEKDLDAKLIKSSIFRTGHSLIVLAEWETDDGYKIDYNLYSDKFVTAQLIIPKNRELPESLILSTRKYLEVCANN